MTSFFNRFYKALPVAGLFFLTMGMTSALHAATLTYNDPTCDSFELENQGGGSFLLVCVEGGGDQDIIAPSGCTTTVTPPNPLTSSGGSVTFSGACSTNVDASTTYSWTRFGGSGMQQNITSPNVLPENNGASAITYTYTMKACNGAVCTDTSKTVTVPLGTTPPSPDDNKLCDQYSGVSNVVIPWGNSGGVVADAGGKEGVVVAKFTVPAAEKSGSKAITVAEAGTGAIVRTITVSRAACDFRSLVDFGGTKGPMISRSSANFKEFFLTAGAVAGYPTLAPGTYYVNIRNVNASGVNTCKAGACPMTIRVQ
ncbi:MAG: hypothetical protein LBE32_00680 [Burkholderiales bacterium]|jgi:hypothetical protein|nr:hypothetical protein [Burkholderiales bacterium]